MAAQESEVFNIEDCPNYNNFLDIDESMDSIWNYVTEIRPGGRMMFKPEVFTSEGQYDHFLSFLNLDPNVTFEFVTEHPNRHYPEKSFLRYQQYIDGIPIEGGGVVVSGIFAPGQGPGGPAGPCARLGMMVPHIANDINIDLNPTFDQYHAFNLYDTLPSLSPDSLTMIDADLVITSNMNLDCNYHLAWKFSYLNEYNAERFAYVNAHTGDILNSGYTFMENLPAETDHYGVQFLENFQEGGTTWLRSPDERINVYHFTLPDCNYNVDIHFVDDSIPFTQNQFDWGNETSQGAYQAFFVAQTVRPYLEDLGVEFEELNLLVGCREFRAINFSADRLTGSSYTAYGLDFAERSLATFGNVCHEIGHSHIFKFIIPNQLSNRSLHEGIADMFGIYCDWRFTNTLNWMFGHETEFEENVFGVRDLSNPAQDCFSEIQNLAIGHHERSTPLSHLFFLLVEGGAAYNAPTFPVDVALELILDGLPELNRGQSDYPHLMDATISQAIENFGYCSDEVIALIQAWEEICVDTDYEIITNDDQTVDLSDCTYFLKGTMETCWNSDNAQICLNLPDSINHGVNPNTITWTITGPGSAEFESAGGMQGNQQQGGTCLKIISIPELEYYPRIYNIRVDFTTSEGPMTFNHRLVMIDCTGTKPDCEGYHAQRVFDDNNQHEQEENPDQNEIEDQDFKTMEVYDMLGRLLYQGRIMDINTIDVPRHQVLIIRYLGENGQVKKTHKTIKVR